MRLFSAVSAASIIAKVARDRYMMAAAAQYPGFGFEHHVGYGTAEHLLALKNFGDYPGTSPKLPTNSPYYGDMTTTETGRRAETAAAVYLATHGFAILARNWRTRSCEIDLVAPA